ncbi:MAG TPA: hypothetical protein DCS67_03135 [Clostridiales bacterium UBA8960]|nr:hypothetical protein [Clostridiales bacterium UBA8960]
MRCEMGNREFRRLNEEDLSRVLQMEKDFRSNFICEENARIFLANPMCWMVACLDEGRVIGFAYGYELNRLNDIGNMLYIHEVGVLPEYQQQGVGKLIFAELKALCKQKRICRIFLFTEKSNQPACGLYESVGGEAAHVDDVAYFFNLLDI